MTQAQGPSSVVVGLAGGLGNQMFQYAAGRALAVRLGVPLVLDTSWFSASVNRQFALAPFRIDCEYRAQAAFLPNPIQSLVSRISRRYFPWVLGAPVWREPHFHYCEAFESIERPVFLEGYWQSELYFQNVKSVIAKEFQLREGMPVTCSSILKRIEACDAICVHVRRGDYLSDSASSSIYGVCSKEYYLNGVNRLLEGEGDPTCFVFSDDPLWAKDNLFFNCPTVVVDINGPDEAHLDLVLMSSCKHFVIANSTLSWWGAWLANHRGKRVIAPSQWFQTGAKDTRDLLPGSWLRM